MYFKEKEDTNIDKEFADKKTFGLNFNNLNPKKLLFIVGGIVIFIIILIIIISLTTNKDKKQNDTYILELTGRENITINLGDEYIEPGFKAFKGNTDVTDKVEIVNNVDNKKIGEYEISYSIGDKKVTRYVKVQENVDVTYIYLLGEKNMYLEVGEKFIEPGYQVYDSKEQNLTEKLIVTGTVDTNKIGVYRLTYTVVNSRNKTTSVVRTVIVVEKGKKPKN